MDQVSGQMQLGPGLPECFLLQNHCTNHVDPQIEAGVQTDRSRLLRQRRLWLHQHESSSFRPRSGAPGMCFSHEALWLFA